ncbi:MAG: 30S ribosomal protein S20 [Candidatus Dependentiae bacterium]
MANIKSAKKRAKQTIKKRQKNLTRKTALKTAVKKVVAAIKDGSDVAKAKTLLRDAEAQLSRAKGKGVIHKNTARRKVSRLAKRVAQLERTA